MLLHAPSDGVECRDIWVTSLGKQVTGRSEVALACEAGAVQHVHVRLGRRGEVNLHVGVSLHVHLPDQSLAARAAKPLHPTPTLNGLEDATHPTGDVRPHPHAGDPPEAQVDTCDRQLGDVSLASAVQAIVGAVALAGARHPLAVLALPGVRVHHRCWITALRAIALRADPVVKRWAAPTQRGVEGLNVALFAIGHAHLLDGVQQAQGIAEVRRLDVAVPT
mmetsp:Transcript_59369/g.171519  ORF Transcript_59369/g.171519 Transcript_59369/m.171519 type:complete len:221 (+) Transcript_59369:1692-2354(+)